MLPVACTARAGLSVSICCFLAGCSILVDTRFSVPDAALDGGDDAGEDAGGADAPGTFDLGVADAGGAACAVDLDCTSRLGPRARCARGRCFNLDLPCARVERVQEAIETSPTWYADTCYELLGTIFVRRGATLTIEEGTEIRGLADRAALIVTRTGNIMVEGTPEDPVVMTSGQPVGSRRPGDWGGLALLGRAPINVPGGEDLLEGLADTPDGRYGGGEAPDPEYSCGTLQYLRIEFAGFELARNVELNGLTLGGCGGNTRVDHVQVHYGSDDGVEIFGGEVGLQWVVVSRAQDDSIDWDQGWQGWAQYVAIVQDAPRPDLDEDIYSGGDNAIEADSLSDERPGSPRSRPRLYNWTIVGADGPMSRTRGMLLRDGTSAFMRNFLVLSQPGGLWDVRDLTADCFRRPVGPTCTSTEAFSIDGLVMWNMGPDGETWVLPEPADDDGGFDEAAYVSTSTIDRLVLIPRAGSPALVQPDIDGRSMLDLRPIASSRANLVDADPPPYVDPPEQVQPSGRDYAGAFEPGGQDWTRGWTAFPEN